MDAKAHQQYVNTAFESDQQTERPLNGVASTSRLSSNSLSISQDPGGGRSAEGSRRSPSPSSRRQNSMADVALALTPSASIHGSTNDVRGGSSISASSFLAHIRRSQHQFNYVHPFGNNASILEELLCEDDDEALTRGKSMQRSPAKLLIWIVFCGFMIGVAGAIILGAESFSGKSYSPALSSMTTKSSLMDSLRMTTSAPS